MRLLGCGAAQQVLAQKIDHCGIFVVIAGERAGLVSTCVYHMGRGKRGQLGIAGDSTASRAGRVMRRGGRRAG